MVTRMQASPVRRTDIAWLGLAVGNLAKLAVVGAMLGVFGISLLVG